MVLLSYIYNIDSDRQLCEEVGYNLSYRWFCKLSLKDSVPDHSSISRIRDRLGEKTYEEIFYRVVEQCRSAGLVKLKQVMVDGSVIKANASIYNMQSRESEEKRDESAFGDEASKPPTEHAHSNDGLSTNDLRKRKIGGEKISNETHFNPSDPEATLSGKKGENKSLAYKTHSAIDADSRVIIDCHVTTGSVSDVTVFGDRIAHIEDHFESKIGEVVADRGYGSAENLVDLKNKNIESNIPLWSTRTGQSLFTDLEKGFRIDDANKTAHCPAGHKMKYRGRDNTHGRSRFEMFANICPSCPLSGQCLSERERAAKKKTFYVSDHYQVWLEVNEKSQTPEFKMKLWERMWKMEGIFAEAKSHHGMRRARYRGRAKTQMQIYMISTVQNLKRLAASAVEPLISMLLELNEIIISRHYFWKARFCDF